MNMNGNIFSPLKTRQEAIKAISYVTAGVYILAGIHLLLMFTNSWRYVIDVLIYAYCGYSLKRWYSKEAAAILIILAVWNTISTFIYAANVRRDGPTNIVMALAILYISVRAVEATFKLHGDLQLEPDHQAEPSAESVPVSTIEQPKLPETETAVAESADAKEWYILLGPKGRAFSQGEVKALYEAGKVKIRGGYTLNEIRNYHEKGMISPSTILCRKSDSEWLPFYRQNIKPADSTIAAQPAEKQEEEWFILTGMKGKVLDTNYVKGLYDTKKVQIKGPVTTAALIAYHEKNTIDNETIVNRKGERDWLPLAKQKIPQIDTSIAAAIFTAAPPSPSKTGFDRFLSEVYFSLFSRKKAVVFSLALVGAIYAGYDYYSQRPEQIYERIKKSVVLISTESDKGQTTSLGTGFILDGGIIATNFHVIQNSTAVRIKTGEHRPLDIDGVVHVDPENDLALLKIKGEKAGLHSIPRNDAEDINIGERVYSIGNPGGLEFSLSEGIVSGKRDNDPMDSKRRDLIQITAPISPGSSGGPLLDRKGRVIGVTSMASKNDYQNLNFAIPIKYIDKTKKYQEILIRFLPEKPKWESLNSGNVKTPSFDRYQAGESNRIVDAYYNPESVVSFGDQRKRFWAKFYLKQNYNLSSMVTTNFEVDGYTLIEVDCKSSRYKTNIGVAESEGKTFVRKSDFSDGSKWNEMDDDDKQLFSRICKP